ncbi:phenylacetic acid degradation protein PaaN [Couchioplanes caeruleus]|uniref:Phenylacetic acid degradation protein PaaN n=2 Tax=Couchioplanes caeruleus TaxID=56438 RepID=A0A1K0GSS0_9ACTN|nr:phenylacetic acid degradation protein PaaN [Couchioplanes caeruleus]OJF12331.1 phenylacetic acid degradation protein PaaN [Couchioplanes caeruleus subsp. caeruleus]ROP34486.1 phenylacetic acid degradation protein paaN [Couchioplanes caeruleus]
MTTPAEFYETHRELLDKAIEAAGARDYWSAYPESPSKSIYGETAAADGEQAFKALLGKDFPVEVPGATTHVATERSPYGIELGIRYPKGEPGELIAAARAALPGWRAVGPHGRAGIAAEILRRINARIFEMAHAVQHTSGQAFVMAFQAGGAHAQDRALEAIAVALAESTRIPGTTTWSKPQRGGDPLRLEKTSTVVGRGVSLMIGCNTFPTWNGYPGLFASLVTGNPVIVKPHPGAVLPLAITVQIAREVLAEAGQDPNVVTLAVEEPGESIAATLATHRDVRIVDFTGSSEFGNWLEANARQAVVYTEKAGLNTVIVDSTDDYKAMLRNLAFSLSLYSGQMCTTPQNLLVPAGGIETDAGHRSPDEFAADLGAAVGKLLGDPKRAAGTLGAIVNDGVLARLAEAGSLPSVVHASTEVADEQFPGATIRTPLIARLDAADEKAYTREWFGPISFVITTESTEHSLRLFTETVRDHGALTASVYSTSDEVLAAAREAALDAGVHLSQNLLGGVFVNQTAAFSDLHGTAANPAATASLSDSAFVTGRFFTLQSRHHLSEQSHA